MVKFFILVILVFLVLGLAAAVMRRMNAISERIATLQHEMKKNELKVELQLQKMQEQEDVDNNREKNS
jgi:Na+-transporting methylmalonyl-CoA/oxaloacetate decarboxylase gamma subunit